MPGREPPRSPTPRPGRTASESMNRSPRTTLSAPPSWREARYRIRGDTPFAPGGRLREDVVWPCCERRRSPASCPPQQRIACARDRTEGHTPQFAGRKTAVPAEKRPVRRRGDGESRQALSSGGDALAATQPTTPQNPASVRGQHPLAKAVDLVAAAAVRLKCALHRYPLPP